MEGLRILSSVVLDVSTKPRRETQFVESPGGEVHHDLCGVFFSSGEAKAIDFEEENADHEPRAFVSVDKRMIADDSGHVGRGHFHEAGFLTIGMELAWSRERGFEEACITHTHPAAFDREETIVKKDGLTNVDPDRLAHFARVCRVLR